MASHGAFSAKAFGPIGRFLCRFRYPVSLPQDIAEVLDLRVTNFIRFDKLLQMVTGPETCPARLSRMMPRAHAERVFRSAVRIDCFHSKSLYSYYFPGGWLEFTLYFDDSSRLRRMFVQHRSIVNEQGVEINLGPGQE
ncbi:Uncharacterized protein SCG7086_AO_00150 [Chlamydiales bacterium SCGC AG-110-P3]|nr:Uncharacterized protein SCG7086_AO_00150 [Chlamydiales bacterium SCGC AG-110-P3]